LITIPIRRNRQSRRAPKYFAEPHQRLTRFPPIFPTSATRPPCYREADHESDQPPPITQRRASNPPNTHPRLISGHRSRKNVNLPNEPNFSQLPSFTTGPSILLKTQQTRLGSTDFRTQAEPTQPANRPTNRPFPRLSQVPNRTQPTTYCGSPDENPLYSIRCTLLPHNSRLP